MLSFLVLSIMSQVAAQDGSPRPSELSKHWEAKFEAPQRLRANEELVRVEEPGFACPSLVDLNGDGEKDLVLGQLKDGRMKAYPGLGGQRFGPGDWLQAEGNDVLTPGVW